MADYQAVALDATGHATGAVVTANAPSSQEAAVNALGQFWFDAENRLFAGHKGLLQP
mgnify:CR=1 FL=1